MEVDEVVSVRDGELSLCLHFSVLTSCCAPLLEEAFAAKHMPDLGHDVKDQKSFTWPLKNWKKLDKKLTSPEFECGGHKWWGQTQAYCCSLTYSPSLFLPGGFSYFHSEIPMHRPMTQFLYTSTTRNQRRRQKDGMHVLSLPSSFRMFMIQPSSLLAVRTGFDVLLPRLTVSMKTLIIVSSRRSATGDLLASASCVNYLIPTKTNRDQLLRTKLLI